MSKKILSLSVILTILVTIVACASNSPEHEIKELVKDIPIPVRYNGLTGEPLKVSCDDIKVNRVSSAWSYNPITGKNITRYRITLYYGGFLSFDNTSYTAYLTLWESSTYQFGQLRQEFTLEEIYKYIDELYWE